MQSDESTEQDASTNQYQPTVPDEEDTWEGDSAVGGVRSYAYVLPLLTLAMASEGQQSDSPPQRSSLTSLTPSIYEVIEEHGRTYHSYKSGSSSPFLHCGIDGDKLTLTETEYLLPNDEVCSTVLSRLGYRLTSFSSRKNNIV
jgi:hypothetical protein